jgi:hypothetical protein
MMRTILVPLGQGLSSEPALDAALSLAKRLNSHIRAVFVRPDPSVALSFLPSTIATTEMRQAIERESNPTERPQLYWRGPARYGRQIRGDADRHGAYTHSRLRQRFLGASCSVSSGEYPD